MIRYRIEDFLSQLDQNGARINLTYKNKSTYQTWFGGILTILSRLGILVFFLLIVNNIINKEKTITISSIGKSPTQDYQSYLIDQTNFDIGFSLTFADGLPHLEEKLNYFRYYDIQIQYVKNTQKNDSNGTIIRSLITTNIPLTNCSLNRFANLSKEIIDYGINQPGWYCPSDISLLLIGQVQSVYKDRFRLVVGICKNSTTNNNSCAPYSEIVALSQKSRLQIATLNTYFDQDEFQKIPIKRSLSVETFPVAMNFQQTIQRQLRKKTIITKDSWISSQLQNQEYVFYQDIQGYIKLATSNTQFILFTYSCDSEENVITRKVLSLADAAATVGGFAGIILILSRVLAKIYSSPILNYQLLRDLYKYEPRTTLPDYEFKRFRSFNSSEKLDHLKDILDQRNILELNPIKEHIFSILSKCFQRLKNRNQIKMYKYGIDSLKKSLDVIKILKAIQRMKTLERIVLKDYQRKLIKHSKRNLLVYKNTNAYTRKRTQQEKDRVIEQSLEQVILNKNKQFNQGLIREIIGSSQIKSLNESTKSNSIIRMNNDSTNSIIQNLTSLKPGTQYDQNDSELDSRREFLNMSKFNTFVRRKKVRISTKEVL